MRSYQNECRKVNIGQYVKKNNHDVTTHKLLCLADSYQLIAQADIPVNNWHDEARYCP